MRRLTRSLVKVAVPVVVGGLVAASGGLALADDKPMVIPVVTLDFCDKHHGPYVLYLNGFDQNNEAQAGEYEISPEDVNECWKASGDPVQDPKTGETTSEHLLWSTLKPPTATYDYVSPEYESKTVVCDIARNAPNMSTQRCYAPLDPERQSSVEVDPGGPEDGLGEVPREVEVEVEVEVFG